MAKDIEEYNVSLCIKIKIYLFIFILYKQICLYFILYNQVNAPVNPFIPDDKILEWSKSK